MRMTTNHAPATVTNTKSARSSQIMQTGAMFDLLSTRLYSRPIDAAIRETLKNALDAHIDAKQTQPVQITTPTSSDPHLIIRDFGKGLSPDQVYSNFINYGDTSKDDSPDQHGGMGIGSKAPFSITDQFSIVSRYDSTETTYIFFRQPGQGPEIASATSRPIPADDTGLEIIIPIEPPFYKATDILTKLLRYFPAGFATVDDVPFDVPKPLYENEYGRLEAKNTFNEVQVQAGPVLYDYDNAHHLELFQGMFNITLTIPASQVTVAPSRESLIDDERTRNAYKDQLLKFIELLPTEHIAHVCKYLPDTMNKQLTYDPAAPNYSRNNGTETRKLLTRYLDDIKSRCHNIPKGDLKAVYRVNDVRRLVSPPKQHLDYPDGYWAVPDVVVIHDDILPPKPKKYWERVKMLNLSNKERVVIVTTPPPKKANVPHIKLSSLLLPPPPPRTASRQTLSNFRVWRGRGDSQYGEHGWFKATSSYVPQNAIIHDAPIQSYEFTSWGVDLKRVIIHHKNPTKLETFTEYKAKMVKEFLADPGRVHAHVLYNTHQNLTHRERQFNRLLTIADDPAHIPEQDRTSPPYFNQFQPHLPLYDLTAFRQAIKDYPLLWLYAEYGDIKPTVKAIMSAPNARYHKRFPISAEVISVDAFKTLTYLPDGHGHPSDGVRIDPETFIKHNEFSNIPSDASHIVWFPN